MSTPLLTVWREGILDQWHALPGRIRYVGLGEWVSRRQGSQARTERSRQVMARLHGRVLITTADNISRTGRLIVTAIALV